MSQPLVQTDKIVPPDFNTWWQNSKFELKSEINCMALGTVQSFDPTNQTVNVLINYLRVIKGGTTPPVQPGNVISDPSSDVSADKYITMCQLVKCPLMINNGGGASITFPVASGDTCLILFNDRDIDTWYTTGSISSAPNSNRLHDLNDAIVIVGIRNVQNAIQSYNMNALNLSYGVSNIAIHQSGIQIQANAVTLRVALDALLMALTSWVNTDATTPNPATVAAIAAAKVLIDGILI